VAPGLVLGFSSLFMSKWITLTGCKRPIIDSPPFPHRTKAVLYALVRSFEFSLMMPADDVAWSNIPAIRKTYIKGYEDKGPYMPLRIKPYVEA
jgi:hypothetical protein